MGPQRRPASSHEVCYDGPFGQRFALNLGSMTHNLAMTRHKGDWIAVGGRHNRLQDRLPEYSPLLRGAHGELAALGWWNGTAGVLASELQDWPDRMALLDSSNPRVGRLPGRNNKLAHGLRRAIGPTGMRQLDALPITQVSHIPRRGLWMMRGSSWSYDAHEGRPWLTPKGGVDEPPKSPWRDKRLIIDGHHPGCLERRNASLDGGEFYHLLPGFICEYDGRLSIVHFHSSLLLFARSNPAERGSRHVQVTRSDDDGATWSAFQQVTLHGYQGLGDIYFFGVQVNPAHDDSLLAVFPIVHRLRGCIAMAASTDGVHWSTATPLLSCSIFGERALDQPALPAMVARGSEVWLYVQEEVPGITIDRRTPRFAYAQMSRYEKPSSVVRYAFPCSKLAKWTEGALQEWRHVYGTFRNDTFQSSCTGSDPGPPRSASGCAWDAHAYVQDVSRAATPEQHHRKKRRSRTKTKLKPPETDRLV